MPVGQGLLLLACALASCYSAELDIGTVAEANCVRFSGFIALPGIVDVQVARGECGCVSVEALPLTERLLLTGSIDTRGRAGSFASGVNVRYTLADGQLRNVRVVIKATIAALITWTPTLPVASIHVIGSSPELLHTLRWEHGHEVESVTVLGQHLGLSIQKNPQHWDLTLCPATTGCGSFSAWLCLAGKKFEKKYLYSWESRPPGVMTGQVNLGIVPAKDTFVFSLPLSSGQVAEAIAEVILNVPGLTLSAWSRGARSIECSIAVDAASRRTIEAYSGFLTLTLATADSMVEKYSLPVIGLSSRVGGGR